MHTTHSLLSTYYIVLSDFWSFCVSGFVVIVNHKPHTVDARATSPEFIMMSTAHGYIKSLNAFIMHAYEIIIMYYIIQCISWILCSKEETN